MTTPEPTGVAQASRRLLYMEDDSGLARLFKRRMEQLGFQVDLAADGRIGLQMCQQHYYDVAVIDYKMPQLNGLEVIETLSNWPAAPATIMITGVGDESLAVQAMRMGAGDYLVKDTNAGYLELLPIVIEKVLEQQRLERERQQVLSLVQERNRALSMLNRASHQLASILETPRLREQLMRTTISVLNAEGCSLWLWGHGRQYLECKAVIHDTKSPPLEGVRVAKGQGVVGWVAQNNQGAVVPQADLDDRFFAQIDSQIDFKTHSLLAVPLLSGPEVLGVLEVVNKREGVFNTEDLTVAETLAASAATAIDNARLVEALRDRTADLEERNAELDAFAHTVAHDLQNMLARVVGFAELLAMDLAADASHAMSREEMQGVAQLIAGNSRKMSKVIEALLLLSAVRQTEVTLRPLDTAAVVKEVTERLSDLISERNATLEVADDWAEAYGYAPWVEEVWFNYLGNALKYGGEPPSIALGSEALPQQQMVRFWVADKGPGIAPDDQTRLFTPFTQIGKKRKRGHGLGLSIVVRIVAKMGGQVGVESQPGMGSKFWFTLPTAERYLAESPLGD